MKLYELTGNYLKVADLLENADEESIGTLQETLDAIEDSIEVKVENTLKLMKNFEAEALAIKAEAQRLSARATAKQNEAGRLKEYVKGQLLFAGLEKMKTSLFSASIRSNPESVVITNLKSLPKKFKVVAEPKPDLNAIKNAIKLGETVRGAKLESSGTSITIR